MLCCTNSKIGLALVVGIGAGFVINASLAPTQAIQPETEEMDMSEMDMSNMSPEEIIDMMRGMNQPGEAHDKLNFLIGDWDVQGSFNWPDGSSTESTGTMSCEWTLGDRFIKMNFHLEDFMNDDFHGVGYTGYDNTKQQYIGVWLDDFSTGISTNEGEFKDDGTYVAIGNNAMGGKMKIVSTMVSADTIEDVFYEMMPGSDEWMETGSFTYTRQ